MSFTGFMKQINKANQMISEKIGGAKGTELENDFYVMEKRTDAIGRLIDDVRDRTNEFLQPNPASRAKLWTVNNLSKMRGNVKSTPYPQPEGTLGETMIKYGKDLGDESVFGHALNDTGESLRQMAGIKYALEDNIKQNFLDPLVLIKENELKEVMQHRKKTESRRLDYDCKKRKKLQGSHVSEEEIQQANEKFEESRTHSVQAMDRLLSNDAEHIDHLIGFAEGFLEYHKQCHEILRATVEQLRQRRKQVSLSASSKTGGSQSSMRQPGSTSRLNQMGYPPSGSMSKHGSNEGSPSSTSHRIHDSGASNHTSANLFGDNGTNSSSMNSHNNHTTPYPSMSMPAPAPPSSSSYQQEKVNNSAPAVNRPAAAVGGKQLPCCRALYDFEAENSEELDFKEGTMIKLLANLDENWLLGELNGRQGRFPVSYVEIVVPIS